MQRRAFLRTAGLGAAALALPATAFTARSFTPRGLHAAVSSILARELPYLKLDPEGVARFADEYFAEATLQQQMRVRVLALLRRPTEDSWLVGNLVEEFLMGSDFFRTGMDESRVVQFQGIYTPYLRPCQHPFSAAFYPDHAIQPG